MSQYGSIPPPGNYVPPNQGTPAQGYQQQQPTPSPYQPTAPYGAPGHPHKGGNTFGQMMNQAVTTGKPMFNKLGKTISSKLGSKPAGPPQHLQSYQNYQEQQGQQGQQGQHGQQGQTQGYQQQQQQQQQGQPFSPQPQQQQQWGQPQQQQQQNAFSSQQSPFHSNYASPASGHSGQSNYFAQQPNQLPNSHPETPQQPPNQTFNAAHFEQSGMSMEQYMQTQHGQQAQQGQGQIMPGQQAPFQQEQAMQGQYPGQQEQQLQGQYSGQQMGVVGGSQSVPQPQTMPPQGLQSPGMANVSPVQPYQSQWAPPSAPPQQVGSPIPGQPYQPSPSPMQHEHQQHQSPQQQWNNMTPISPQAQGQMPHQMQNQMLPHSVSPPPSQQANMPPQIPLNKPLQPKSPAPQPAALQQSAPTEFIAELPADMGNLSITESKPTFSAELPAEPVYQAYHAGGAGAGHTGSQSQGFTIPRRSVSTSTLPLADPWRFADPVTETPTREFFILADLLFDALDRKFEPRGTGLLEAPKVLASWVVMSEENKRLYTYRNYSAFSKLWSLQGIPHIMVPTTPSLTSNWNFSQQSHAADLKLLAEPPTHRTLYTAYMPALNRAGWYKFFFLEMAQAPEDIGTLIPALCADTYKPGVLNHPDLSKRDHAEIPALKAKAMEIQGLAVERATQETWSSMMVDPDVPREHTQQVNPPGTQSGNASGQQQQGGEMSAAQMAVQMHKIQSEGQFNDMAVKTVLGGGITFGGNKYSGGYGSLV